VLTSSFCGGAGRADEGGGRRDGRTDIERADSDHRTKVLRRDLDWIGLDWIGLDAWVATVMAMVDVWLRELSDDEDDSTTVLSFPCCLDTWKRVLPPSLSLSLSVVGCLLGTEAS